MKASRTIVFVLACALGVAAAAAQTYPTRPVRLVVASAAGGGTDFVARAINAKFGEFLGNHVVNDNRGGVGGLVGAEIVANAPADGHTLLLIPSSFVILPSIHKKLPFDVLKDFAPVVNVASTPFILVVNASLPATTLPQLIELARTRKGGINFASPGIGSIGHLTAELFKTVAKAPMQHVTYKGGGPALIALAGNEVEVFFSTVPSAIVQVKAGRLRALGVTSAKRSSAAPQIPTIAEQGLPGFDVVTWLGMFAPARTPAAIVNAVNANVNKALALPEIKEQFLVSGVEAEGGTPQRFGEQVRQDMKKWGTVAAQSGVKAE